MSAPSTTPSSPAAAAVLTHDAPFSRYASASSSSPLLLATDGQSATDASATVAQLLATQLKTRIQVVAALDVRAPLPTAIDSRTNMPRVESLRRDELTDIVRERIERVLDPHSHWDLAVHVGAPARVVAEVARQLGARLVVMGRGQRRALHFLIGEELALQVVRHSAVPVLVVPPEMYVLPRVALVAMDFGAASVVAARSALALLDHRADGARRLVMLHVRPWVAAGWDRTDGHVLEDDPHVARLFKRLDALLAPDVPEGVTIEHRLAAGDVNKRLMAEVAEVGADLIVLGTHGRGLMERLFVGSVAITTLRNAATAVLIAPSPSSAERVRLELQLWEQVALNRAADFAAALDLFTQRNIGRPSRLETTDATRGETHVQLDGYRFDGASWDPHTRRAALDFSAEAEASRHLSHGIVDVQSVEIIAGREQQDHALLVEDARGYSVLTFHA